MAKNGIAALYKSPSTIFTPQELAAMWGITNYDYLKSRIQYYIKNGYLFRLSRGLYTKDEHEFDTLEAACKLRAPSYVSLETILVRKGVLFQRYSSIFLISYATKTVKIDDMSFDYKKIKDEILFNRNGIDSTGNYCVASCERAFLDAVYLYKNYHFDNLRPIDWTKVFELTSLYKSTILVKRVKDYQEDAQSR